MFNQSSFLSPPLPLPSEIQDTLSSYPFLISVNWICLFLGCCASLHLLGIELSGSSALLSQLSLIVLISSIHNLHSISPSSILFSAIVSLPVLIVLLNLCPLLTLVCSYRREQRLTYLTECLKILTFKRLAFYSISIYSWTKAILVYISSLPSFSSCAVVPSHTLSALG